MFWGSLQAPSIRRGFEFEPVIVDIQSLNEWSLEGRLEVDAAMSAATCPRVHERYALLPHGASFGSGYGPIVVARERLTLDELRNEEIVVPGKLATAFLVLQMALGGEFACRVMPFDQILDEVASGRSRVGLIIHEGQLTYGDAGVEKCLDLGEWWLLETGLPLPLGVNTVRRDLGPNRMREVSAILRESIDAALAHRDEALEYALAFGRGLDDVRGDRFIEMYVNDLTLDYGDEGRQAVRELLERRTRAFRLNGVQ